MSQLNTYDPTTSYLTDADVAKILGISWIAVSLMCSRGEIVAVPMPNPITGKPVPGRYYIHSTALNEYMWKQWQAEGRTMIVRINSATPDEAEDAFARAISPWHAEPGATHSLYITDYHFPDCSQGPEVVAWCKSAKERGLIITFSIRTPRPKRS